jgi:hypothetical protein
VADFGQDDIDTVLVDGAQASGGNAQLDQRFSLATQKRRSWMFGWNLRRVALLACETLLPLITLLPVTWQIRLMTYPRYRWFQPWPGWIRPLLPGVL